MARMTAFDSPLLLGFDHFERMLDRIAKTGNDGYPPYNIERTGQNGLRITLAIAGFAMDDLLVTLEDNQLTIRGKLGEADAGRIFLPRGSAGRGLVAPARWTPAGPQDCQPCSYTSVRSGPAGSAANPSAP